VAIANSDEIDVSIDDNTFDGAVAGVRTTSSDSPVSEPNVSVSITNNDFIGDNTAWYVEDNLDVLNLGAVLNDQDNTFDPTGGVDGNQIVVQQ
jgi:outer membrane protein W